MRYLGDSDLELLLRVAIHESKRRGRPVQVVDGRSTNTPAAASEPLTKQKPQTNSLGANRTPSGLTRGHANAVRAAFQAGVTPARIARQFGLSQSQVRKALSSDERQTSVYFREEEARVTARLSMQTRPLIFSG